MKRLIFYCGIVILFFSIEVYADPVDGLDYQSESVATAEFVNAGMLNPAGLSFFGSNGIRYTHNFTDSTYSGDDALLISSRRGFFGIEWLKHTTNQFRRKYTFAIGDRVAPNFYLGFSYSWFGGSIKEYKDMKNFKIGMLYRYGRYLSLGFVADKLTQPKFGSRKIYRQYTPGLAVRPFGEKITFSADALLTEGTSIKDAAGRFRIAAIPFSGIGFTVDYAVEGTWKFGITFDFDQFKIGGQGKLNSSKDYSGGGYFINLGAIRYDSVVRNNRDKIGLVVFQGNLREEPGPRYIFGKEGNSFLRTVTDLRKGVDDKRIGSLLIKLDQARMSFAQAQEIRSALADYRQHGKKVTAYIENGGDLAYYLASGADEIIMNPSGYLMLKGIAAQATFYKGAMDKIGVSVQAIHTGPHKDALSAFTDDSLSVESRDQIDWLLDDLYGQLVEGISDGRNISKEKAAEIIDNGPYTARDANEAGLIDRLSYYDDIVGKDRTGEYVNLNSFYRTKDYNPRWGEPKKIAVVYADGSIVDGKSGDGIFQGKLVGGKTLASNLAKIRADRDIKAVVLRVDSPGGSVFGSDMIYHELELLKGKKPLVVSMGGVAASGGYYISCPGDEILASPSTITGSIGVLIGKPVFAGLYDKLGIRKQFIKRGKHSDLTSTAVPASDEEMELVSRQVWQTYGEFVSKVSTWRKMDYDSVDAMGRGKVWTGRQAIDKGLVDSYGGIWDAIEQARQKADIDQDDKIILETYPKRGFSLFRFPGLSVTSGSLEDLIGRTFSSGLQMRLPFDLEIE